MDINSEVITWFWWLVIVVLLLRAYVRYARINEVNEAEGRVFGPGIWRITLVLLLPWAVRQAEKDLWNEQKNNR